jgi:hypothetical protein
VLSYGSPSTSGSAMKRSAAGGGHWSAVNHVITTSPGSNGTGRRRSGRDPQWSGVPSSGPTLRAASTLGRIRYPKPVHPPTWPPRMRMARRRRTQRLWRSTGPLGIAAHPDRPLSSPSFSPKARVLSAETSAFAPAPAPPDQAPGCSNSLGMAPRSPSQDKASSPDPASPDLGREGGARARR